MSGPDQFDILFDPQHPYHHAREMLRVGRLEAAKLAVRSIPEDVRVQHEVEWLSTMVFLFEQMNLEHLAVDVGIKLMEQVRKREIVPTNDAFAPLV